MQEKAQIDSVIKLGLPLNHLVNEAERGGRSELLLVSLSSSPFVASHIEWVKAARFMQLRYNVH